LFAIDWSDYSFSGLLTSGDLAVSPGAADAPGSSSR
jgi:hypothetical protein